MYEIQLNNAGRFYDLLNERCRNLVLQILLRFDRSSTSFKSYHYQLIVFKNIFMGFEVLCADMKLCVLFCSVVYRFEVMCIGLKLRTVVQF